MGIAPTAGFNWFWPAVGLGVTTLFFAGIAFYLLDKQKKQKKYAWLVEVMAECQENPMGMVVDKGGRMIPFVVEHDTKNKGLLQHKKYTLVHPDMTAPNTKHRLAKGPELSFYPLPGYLPFSIQSSAALVQLAEKLRNDKRFSWITHELDLIALVFNNTESFPRDAKQLINNCVAFGDEIPDDYLNRIDEDEYEDEEEFQDEELQDNELNAGIDDGQ